MYKSMTDKITDHLIINESRQISSQNMDILYKKVTSESISSFQFGKVNIEINDFPKNLGESIVQEVFISLG